MKPKTSPPRNRRLAREALLCALYQHLLAHGTEESALRQQEERQDFSRMDRDYFRCCFLAIISQEKELEALISPFLDRPLEEISPIEHALLWIGAFELKDRPEIPWKVSIFEAVELAKRYGAPESHKYVNAILDKIARSLGRMG